MKHDLPYVVFHSLRHSSITYKLKLNGDDIKAVQGDSGHAQATMVIRIPIPLTTRVYIGEHEATRNAKKARNGPLSDEELEKVSGGIEVDKDAFPYDVIKRYYFQKGAQLAFILFIYLIPSPTGYDVIKYIEWEIGQGNLGYMYNGVHYSTPYDDPEYDDTRCI